MWETYSAVAQLPHFLDEILIFALKLIIQVQKFFRADTNSPCFWTCFFVFRPYLTQWVWWCYMSKIFIMINLSQVFASPWGLPVHLSSAVPWLV